jgi:hypothetical protein
MSWRSSWRSRGGFSDATKAAVAVLQRINKVTLDGEVCPWCKVRPADEVDHIEARANGGGNLVWNGMWICGVCNKKKSARPLGDWISLVRKTEGITDIEVWLRCKDKSEYAVEIGRKLRKEIGWRPSEMVVEEEPVIVPRPNPINAFNSPMMLYDIFSNDRLIQYQLFGCRRQGWM